MKKVLVSILAALLLIPQTLYAGSPYASMKVGAYHVDENDAMYGVKHVDNKPRVSSMPYLYDISEGNVANHEAVYNFGRNGDLDDDEETIWAEGGLYVFPSAATSMKVSSSHANDTSTGIGMRTVIIKGLDSDWAELTETVTLNGGTFVYTTGEYLRINSMEGASAGTNATNIGAVYIGVGTVTSGKPATVYGNMPVASGHTSMAVYSVAAGRSFYLTDFITASSTAKETTVSFHADNFGGVSQERFGTTIYQDHIHIPMLLPFRVPEKSDIELRAISSSGANAIVSGTLVGWVENN